MHEKGKQHAIPRFTESSLQTPAKRHSAAFPVLQPQVKHTAEVQCRPLHDRTAILARKSELIIQNRNMGIPSLLSWLCLEIKKRRSEVPAELGYLT